MAKIEYRKINFFPKRRDIVDKCNGIIEEWRAKGFTLTLRQIYYRMIALDLFPATWIDDEYNKKHGLAPGTKNTLRNYKRLGEILVDARLGGLVDWEAMEDRTRSLREMRTWESPEAALKWAADQFLSDKWTDQPRRFEVWVEKDALIGIFESICTHADIAIPFFSCRGYNSESEMHNAAQRINWYREKHGQRTTILQFSDHDPSGLDMTEDIKRRLRVFQCPVTVNRMALTIKQVKQFKLPPNPAKESDIRFEKYAGRFGKESWELDALEPDFLLKIVRRAILRGRNRKKWAAAVEKETVDLARLKNAKLPKLTKGK